MEIARNPVCINPNDMPAKAKELMDAGRFRRLPVVEKGGLVGIITERDLSQHLGYLDSTKVDAAMTANPVTITPRDMAEDAARLMLQHKIGGLPVVENGKLVGIVGTNDLMPSAPERGACCRTHNGRLNGARCLPPKRRSELDNPELGEVPGAHGEAARLGCPCEGTSRRSPNQPGPSGSGRKAGRHRDRSRSA